MYGKMAKRSIGAGALALILGVVGAAAWALAPETAPEATPGTVPAFPGAEGAGMWTVGGRGGKVYEVTTLEDGGPGSFREACEAEGPRIVAFRVGGVIRLKERIMINHPYITIAGQTAPGDGICIADKPVWINTYQVAIRYVRVRVGRAGVAAPITDDGLGGRPVSDIIVDHVSCSWAHDENLSLYKMEDVDNDGYAPPTERVTVQWSIVGETLGHRRHPYGGVIGGKNATYHHNLHACNSNWEPYSSIAENPPADRLNLINNVFFVWRNRWLKGGGEGPINIINNYFVPDPRRDERDRQYQILTVSRSVGTPNRYMAGNVVQGYPVETENNWASVRIEADQADRIRAKDPFAMAAPVTIEPAAEAYEAVLAKAGATLPRRDAVDARIVEATRERKTYYLPIEIKHKDWYPFSEDGLMELPEYRSGEAPADTDHDGMPDAWEEAHSLGVEDASDAAADADEDGYTNVEEYLNGTDPGAYVDYKVPGNNVSSL
jgi:hypothetical protein